MSMDMITSFSFTTTENKMASKLETIAGGIAEKATNAPAGTATAFDIALILAILEMVISNCDMATNAEIAQRAKSPGIFGVFRVRRAAREQGVARRDLSRYTNAVISGIDERTAEDVEEALGELRQAAL